MKNGTMPSGWKQTPLADCGRWVSGGTPRKSQATYWGGEIPWISAKSLKVFDIRDSVDRVTVEGAEKGTTLVPEGTILFVVRGMSLAKEFRVGVALRELTFNQDLRAIIPAENVNPRFLARFLRHSQSQILAKVNNASHGTKRLKTEQIRDFEIPLPPLPEQTRIANILDKADTIRRKRQVAVCEAHDLRRASFRGLFGDVAANDCNWQEFTVGEAGRVQLGRQRSPKYQSGKHTHHYMRVANVFEDRIDLSDVLSMDFDGNEFPKYKLAYGDILLNEGQSTELVGRPAMWRNELDDCCFQNTLIRFRANTEIVEPEYALGVFIEYLHRGRFANVSSKTSNMAHLGASRFAKMPFPVPPIELQRQYARQREQMRVLADQQAKAKSESDELFNSLVQRAFRGEL